MKTSIIQKIDKFGMLISVSLLGFTAGYNKGMDRIFVIILTIIIIIIFGVKDE